MKRLFLILLILLIPSLAWGALVPAIEVRSANTPTTTVEVGEEVYFSASGTTYDGTAALLGLARYEWDFGDGYYLRHDPAYPTVTRSGIAATHYYMAPGEYTVTMSTKIFAGFNSNGDPSSLVGTTSPGKMLGIQSKFILMELLPSLMYNLMEEAHTHLLVSILTTQDTYLSVGLGVLAQQKQEIFILDTFMYLRHRWRK